METPTKVPRSWVLVGHYFRVLALFSIIHMISSLFRRTRLSIDLTFLLLFWIAQGLLNGKRWARNVALACCGLMAAGALASLANGAIQLRQDSWGSLAALQFAAVSSGLLLMLFVFPLILLLRPSPSEEEPDAAWTGGRAGRYFLGALLLGALAAVVDLQEGRVSLLSSTTVIEYGDGKVASSITTYASDDPAGAPSFVSSWVIGDSSTSGTSSGREHTITIGNQRVDPPDVPQVPYLKQLGLPAEPKSQPNILIVRADGRTIRIARRLTLLNQVSIQRGLRGCADFDEMQRRIEALLPPLSGP